MRYRVISAIFDVTKFPPEPVPMSGGHDSAVEGTHRLQAVEIIDTKTNELFSHCEDVNDVEDRVLEFWNRLNPSCIEGPHYTHNGAAKVVVIDCRPATAHDLVDEAART